MPQDKIAEDLRLSRHGALVGLAQQLEPPDIRLMGTLEGK